MATTTLNGAELAILINRFEGIARKMTNTLYRTGRSGVLNRARDFSCCIVTADCQLLATADSLPIHVLVGPDMMAQAMKNFHPELKRGDAFLHNSPYHGSSHAADHVLIIPVIDDKGKHRFTVLTKAHQADCGNAEPTTYMGTAVDVYAEGALIFPAVKVQENYRTNEDMVRMCEMRIRVPEQWKGDFLAMIGSARIGEQEIMRLADEVGWDTLETFCGQWFDYSEQRMITRLSSLPKGEATGSSTHDPIPGTPPEGVRIVASVSALPEEGRIVVDLRDNIDALPCGLNLSEACARSACLIAVFNSIGGDIPRNAGSFRRVEILLRENSVAGIPLHPTSCSVSTTNVADRVTHSVSLAMAELGEGFGTAEFGAFLPPSSAVVSGKDPRTGDPFVNQIFLGCTTGAGTPYEDAWLTYLHVGNGGMCFIDSVELDELYQPILVTERRILEDTEGAGRHIGASSLRVEFGPLGCDVDVAYVSDGKLNPPRGVHGGGTGGGSNQLRRLQDGSTQDLPPAATVRIHQGESIISICCGGGGYGDPARRDPQRVVKDVQDGWVSQQRARDVYRVVLKPDGTLDQGATEAARA
ncbi:hydantoinase B/oxoprolinase family protein [Aureimonas fodinaquatilis]|uniref:Hydantoinase B/oxoprolinase family protein n=1 Tax=Aureimonas fodinaquatilis TaxID=2565783 RepID=A0A5B0DZE0_9HYPH|nr:hydantoinase B/oxoprolinase family protein [Aureimonas fodinaquatilis]KAA0972164.1 hydantoinase B/oxoprolinase family protein [Aureimonas fodinaquatilis]